MEIYWFDLLESTQLKLIDAIKNKTLNPPVAMATTNQTNGIGSRDNKWIGTKGNLFFSFAIRKNCLPIDLPLQSASIYLLFFFKLVLDKYVDGLWQKWPNDIYLNDKKICGMITSSFDGILIGGIGLNCIDSSNGFCSINKKIDYDLLLTEYFKMIDESISWSVVFSKFEVEFYENLNKFLVLKPEFSVQNIILDKDGSLIFGKKKVFSLR